MTKVTEQRFPLNLKPSITWVVQAWNFVGGTMVGQLETRSPTLARNTAKLWKDEGFKVEQFVRED